MKLTYYPKKKVSNYWRRKMDEGEGIAPKVEIRTEVKNAANFESCGIFSKEAYFIFYEPPVALLISYLDALMLEKTLILRDTNQ